MNVKYDFSCWLLKYDGTNIYGKIYQKSSIKVTDGQKIPLLWNHSHGNLNDVLGHAILEKRKDGIYVYGTLSNTSQKELVMKLLRDKGSVSVSPFVTRVKYNKNIITNGVIQEVSLVPERIDSNELYYPILNESEECHEYRI